MFLLLFSACATHLCLAQDDDALPVYPSDLYDPAKPPVANRFGVLYAPEPFTVSMPIKYYGNQPVRVTAYLPFVESESDGTQPMVPFGAHYTTGTVLRSTQHVPFDLYPTIEVLSTDGIGTLSELTGYPFASIMPSGNQPDYYDGSFSLLYHLNDQANANTPNPIPSIYGVTALHIAQRFFKFTSGLLGHKGIDKAGAKLARIILRDTKSLDEVLHFDDRAEFYIDIEDNVNQSYVSKANLASLFALEMFLDPLETEPTEGEALHIAKGFVRILSVAFVSFEKPGGPFLNPSWSYGYEPGIIEENEVVPFDNPKQFGLPSTYKGEFWQDNPGPQNLNESVLQLLFYYLNVAKSGYVDDDESRSYFSTEPLIPGDKYATYSLALKLFYNAVVGKMNVNSTFSDLRFQLLQAAISEGHLPGSPVFERIMTACAAVGIGELPYDSNFDCSITKTGDSWFNGPVQFHVAQVTLEQDPTSKKAILLTDCSSQAFIKTAELDPLIPEKYSVFINKTPDLDGLYGKDKDLIKSRVAISVHAHSIIARDWFRDQFGHLGMDGLGKMSLLNCIGNTMGSDGDIFPSAYEVNLRHTFSLKSACRDEIYRRYTQSIFASRDYPSYLNTDQGEEAHILSSGLSSIFGLAIKRDFEKKKLNPDADEIWQLYEELGDETQVRSFPQPKLHGQVSAYHGSNWVPGDTRVNSGFLQLFFYLLVHGTEGAEGYTNNEPGSLTYFVNKIPWELALQVLWNASRAVSHDPTIEEFRLATLSELHKLDPVQYHPKSKEHIAFYDAWAAVLGLPDYASTLSHYPEEGASVYPWPVKVGAEAEYPPFESYRLFEVSKSSTFTESEHPVHRFVNDKVQVLQEDGITYGEANLEPGQTYWVRSHLADGPGARQHCSTTDDPAFCESLLTKKKWTLPYAFKTEAVPAVINLSPASGEVVRAWSAPFSWGSAPGAAGYEMGVTDGSGTVSEQLLPVDAPYDYEEAEQSQVVETVLALSKETPYTYRVAAAQKLGSQSAVHVLPNGTIYPFTEEEKEAFPDVYGDWTQDITIKTDLPTITLHSPVDQTKVPLFGADVILRANKLSPDRADYYQLYMKEPFYESAAVSDDGPYAHFGVHVPGLTGVEDKKEYQWTMAPRKKAVAPFITQEEEGAIPEWFSFIVSKELAPRPNIGEFACVEAGKPVQMSWDAIPGAQGYEYSIINQATNQEVAHGIVEGMTQAPVISGASQLPGPYLRVVKAGIRDPNGNWIFGPAAEVPYGIKAPSPTDLSPNSNSGPVGLQENNSVILSWILPPGVTSVHLFAQDEQTSEILADHTITGSSAKLNNLQFDHSIFWSLRSEGSDPSCEGSDISVTFQTEREPVSIIPALNFKFTMLCTDHLGWGIGDPFNTYNLTLRDPNGNTIFNEMGLHSMLSMVDENFPAMDGVYTGTMIITHADPVYQTTEELEASVIGFIKLFDKGSGNNQTLDEEVFGSKFDPVTNMIIKLAFEIDTDNFTINLRGNAAADTVKKMIRAVSLEVTYPELEMVVYPNPASSRVQIMPGMHHNGQAFALQVIDQQGRTVIGREWAGEELDVSTLAEGLYIVKVQRDKLLFTQKLIVKRK